MIWNGIPAASGAAAQVVVGQPDFLTVSGGATATKMNLPRGVWTDGTRLVVADTGNHRVLIWNTFPTSNGQAADLVVGQPDFTTATLGIGASKMNLPQSVCSDGSKLFVADSDNNRVLIFDPFPTASNPAATGVLGQNSFTNVVGNDDDQNGTNDGAPTGRTLRHPVGVTAIGNQLFVVDGDNHRVLIFTGT
jgi:DNA-binding beta-propeller fold protein YncE